MSNQIFSNLEVAERLQTKANSLNKKRSRLTAAGQLSEGEHWLKQDGDIYWTQAGLDVLNGGQAIVPLERQDLSSQSDSPLPAGDFPSPAQVAKDNAPAVVARYLAAVDGEMSIEVTRLLTEGDSLKKHLADRWGVA